MSNDRLSVTRQSRIDQNFCGVLTVHAVGRRQVVIDWDWGASGIWLVRVPEEPFTPTPSSEWGPYVPPRDRHHAWHGVLTDELIDAIQAWNDDGDRVMGRGAHEHADEDRITFWARGRELADHVQQQLGNEYEVHCRTPTGHLR